MTTTDLDPDKKRVYDAEHQLQDFLDAYPGSMRIAGTVLTVPVERKFADLNSIQHYLDRVALDLAAGGVLRMSRAVPLVVPYRGIAQATYNWSTNQIRIPDRPTDRSLVRWAMRESVVLHELAHWMTPHGPSHGKEFQSALEMLLREYLAPEAGFAFWFFLAQTHRRV